MSETTNMAEFRKGKCVQSDWTIGCQTMEHEEEGQCGAQLSSKREGMLLV